MTKKLNEGGDRQGAIAGEIVDFILTQGANRVTATDLRSQFRLSPSAASEIMSRLPLFLFSRQKGASLRSAVHLAVQAVVKKSNAFESEISPQLAVTKGLTESQRSRAIEESGAPGDLLHALFRAALAASKDPAPKVKAALDAKVKKLRGQLKGPYAKAVGQVLAVAEKGGTWEDARKAMPGKAVGEAIEEVRDFRGKGETETPGKPTARDFERGTVVAHGTAGVKANYIDIDGTVWYVQGRKVVNRGPLTKFKSDVKAGKIRAKLVEDGPSMPKRSATPQSIAEGVLGIPRSNTRVARPGAEQLAEALPDAAHQSRDRRAKLLQKAKAGVFTGARTIQRVARDDYVASVGRQAIAAAMTPERLDKILRGAGLDPKSFKRNDRGVTFAEAVNEAAPKAVTLTMADQVEMNTGAKGEITPAIHAWASKKWGKGNGVSITSLEAAKQRGSMSIDGPRGKHITITVRGGYVIVKIEGKKAQFFELRESIDEALPSWSGAAEVYRRATKMLDLLGKAGHATAAKFTPKTRKMKAQGGASEEMAALIDALNKGDEKQIKALMMQYMTRFPKLWRQAISESVDEGMTLVQRIYSALKSGGKKGMTFDELMDFMDLPATGVDAAGYSRKYAKDQLEGLTRSYLHKGKTVTKKGGRYIAEANDDKTDDLPAEVERDLKAKAKEMGAKKVTGKGPSINATFDGQKKATAFKAAAEKAGGKCAIRRSGDTEYTVHVDEHLAEEELPEGVVAIGDGRYYADGEIYESLDAISEAEEGVDEAANTVKAAEVAMVSALLTVVGKWVPLTEIAKGPPFRGVNFGKIQSAAKSLARQRVIEMKTDPDAGDVVMMSKTTSETLEALENGEPLDEGRVLRGSELAQAARSGEVLRIGAGGLSRQTRISVFPNSIYWMGASTSPDMIVVTAVAGDRITYASYPFTQTRQGTLRYLVGLIADGTRMHMKTYGARIDSKQKATWDANLRGEKGPLNGKQKLKDYQYILVTCVANEKTKDMYGQTKAYGVLVDYFEANRPEAIDGKETTRIKVQRVSVPSMKANPAFDVVKVGRKVMETEEDFDSWLMENGLDEFTSGGVPNVGGMQPWLGTDRSEVNPLTVPAELEDDDEGEQSLDEALQPTIDGFHQFAVGALTQYDEQQLRRSLKNPRAYHNPHALALYFEALERGMKDRGMRGVKPTSSDADDIRKFAAMLRDFFDEKMPPIKKTLKAIDTYLSSGKAPRYPTAPRRKNALEHAEGFGIPEIDEAVAWIEAHSELLDASLDEAASARKLLDTADTKLVGMLQKGLATLKVAIRKAQSEDQNIRALGIAGAGAKQLLQPVVKALRDYASSVEKLIKQASVAESAEEPLEEGSDRLHGQVQNLFVRNPGHSYTVDDVARLHSVSNAAAMKVLSRLVTEGTLSFKRGEGYALKGGGLARTARSPHRKGSMASRLFGQRTHEELEAIRGSVEDQLDDDLEETTVSAGVGGFARVPIGGYPEQKGRVGGIRDAGKHIKGPKSQWTPEAIGKVVKEMREAMPEHADEPDEFFVAMLDERTMKTVTVYPKSKSGPWVVADPFGNEQEFPSKNAAIGAGRDMAKTEHWGFNLLSGKVAEESIDEAGPKRPATATGVDNKRPVQLGSTERELLRTLRKERGKHGLEELISLSKPLQLLPYQVVLDAAERLAQLGLVGGTGRDILLPFGESSWGRYEQFLLHEGGLDEAEVEVYSRYDALGIPEPDPKTMCPGQCEGTGVVPLIGPLPEGSSRDDYAGVSCDDDPDTIDDMEEPWRTLWLEAEEANPNKDGDRWHFVKCPDCAGSGKRTDEAVTGVVTAKKPAGRQSSSPWTVELHFDPEHEAAVVARLKTEPKAMLPSFKVKKPGLISAEVKSGSLSSAVSFAQVIGNSVKPDESTDETEIIEFPEDLLETYVLASQGAGLDDDPRFTYEDGQFTAEVPATVAPRIRELVAAAR